jgi:hypothetical protein
LTTTTDWAAAGGVICGNEPPRSAAARISFRIKYPSFSLDARSGPAIDHKIRPGSEKEVRQQPLVNSSGAGSGIAAFLWDTFHEANHMIGTLTFWKRIGLSMILLSGLSILTGPAQARTYPRSYIFSAQKRLRASGYYRGPIDGRYNRRTVRALTNFQFDHNLAQTGRLNRMTCAKLGAACKTMLR